MKTLFLSLFFSFSALASNSIIIDVKQSEVSHPELIKVKYFVDTQISSTYFKIFANGREFRSILPELKLKGSGIYFEKDGESVRCADVKLMGLYVRPITGNCRFVIKSERVNYGELDPVMRDVFRIYLVTGAGRSR